jgi:multidrug resistance efflux pump
MPRKPKVGITMTHASMLARLPDQAPRAPSLDIAPAGDPMAMVDRIVRGLESGTESPGTVVEHDSSDSAIEITYLRVRRIATVQTTRLKPANRDDEPVFIAPYPYTRPNAARRVEPMARRGAEAAAPAPPAGHGDTAAGNEASPPSGGGGGSDAPPPVTPKRAGRYLRIGIGVALIGVAAAFAAERVAAMGRSDALLTATRMTIRAPIDGVLSRSAAQPGDMLEAGVTLASLDNDRADTGRYAELAAAVRIAEESVRALESRIADTSAMANDARRHAADFRATRADQLTARLREADANLVASVARQRETDAAMRRASTLYADGFLSAAGYDQARRANDVARADVAAMAQRRNSAAAELAAVRGGVYASDNASDRSVSQQNELQMRTLSQDLAAQLAERRARLDSLRAQLATEQTRLTHAQHADLRVPARGRLQQVLAQSGEYVREGQDVATILDCAKPVVTAAVSENVFRGLRIGTTAVFTSAVTGARYTGPVIGKTATPADGTNGTKEKFSISATIGASWGNRFCEPEPGSIAFAD